MEMVSITYANTFVSLLTNGLIGMTINDTSYLLLGLVKEVIVEHPDIKKTTDKEMKKNMKSTYMYIQI